MLARIKILALAVLLALASASIAAVAHCVDGEHADAGKPALSVSPTEHVDCAVREDGAVAGPLNVTADHGPSAVDQAAAAQTSIGVPASGSAAGASAILEFSDRLSYFPSLLVLRI